MPQSYYSFYGHVIFSAKNRENLISPDIRIPLYKYIHGIVQNEEGKLMEAGGTGNHVHLLISLPPKKSVADFVRTIKTNSSKWVHEDRGLSSFAWQKGYGLFSVSCSELERVKAYIQNQEEHHKKVSFQDEFLRFLKKNNISYDEKYIWG